MTRRIVWTTRPAGGGLHRAVVRCGLSCADAPAHSIVGAPNARLAVERQGRRAALLLQTAQPAHLLMLASRQLEAGEAAATAHPEEAERLADNATALAGFAEALMVEEPIAEALMAETQIAGVGAPAERRG